VKLAKGKISFVISSGGYERTAISGPLRLMGAIALAAKIVMVLGLIFSFWFLRVYFLFSWTWSLSSGLICWEFRLFFLRDFI